MDPSKLTLSGQMNMKGYAEGGPVYDSMVEMTKDPMRYNTELLMRMLDDNKDTEYGRKYGFADSGNTIVVIEHNLDVIKTADYIVDLGPDGGDGGGRVIVCGTPEEVAKHPTSYTAEYLRKVLKGGEWYKED